ncbi:Calcineurin-like metallo-phosphoesterase superfamily protein [Rhynchospora pubera]|uniref:Calcineurin-like metallo-phosphoesterase superfamily protein n=1 Tax=Rhynchospora pubera TaxID=906938 RepID=A0AAV8HNT2_9POAL|nr:Calcineurin-like metallo-phosphoesterase superfamily protein [Rhynchospora pubera]
MDGDASGVHHHGRSKEVSWSRTFLTQAALCFFLFAAFNIGEPQIEVPLSSAPAPDLGSVRSVGPSTDFYFLSVAGGSRPIESQFRLLKQMEMFAKIYKPKFVLNVAQLGEEDPLCHNATHHPELLKMPWYTTTASKGRGIGNFMKKIELPYDQVLEIIGIDTGIFQNLLQNETNNTDFKEQIDWLRQTLAITTADWRIVVGFNPLVVCNKQNNKEAMKLRGLLQDIFLRYRVNAYLSTNGCSSYIYSDRGISYIEHLRPTDKLHGGFLLHGVSPLDIKTYLVDSEGRVKLKYSFTQQGRGAI